jgi:hypothetical protein
MADKYVTKEDEEADLVRALLSLPVSNLESRIQELEAELTKRLKLREELLSKLGTQRLRLEGLVWRMRYQILLQPGSNVRSQAHRQLIQVHSSIANEEVKCFNDCSRLKERLQLAREELNSTRLRLSVVEATD